MAEKGIRLATAIMLCSLLTPWVANADWAVGAKLPDLAQSGLEGQLPDTSGKVLLVDFWASWCAPCKKSFPVLDELQKKHGGKGLVILAISVDQTKKDMQEFLDKQNVSFTALWDAKQKLVKDAGVNAMPSSFLVDRSGTIRFVHQGFHGKRTADQYENEIAELLDKRK